MPTRCLLYYITDRSAFPGDELSRRRRLLEKIAEAARAGVDYIQVREKDLATRDLESLAGEAVGVVRESGKLTTGNRQLGTALLINSRSDVALAVGADGVHLPSQDVSPQEVRAVWDGPRGAGTARDPLIAVSCHSPSDVAQAAAASATFAVLAPVFEKKGASPTGLAILEQACQANIPVLALGGVTRENARSCLDAGAAGIAAIRLFQDNDIVEIVQRLRSNT
jgi:thiamine-phosphate pyrophosphorylase